MSPWVYILILIVAAYLLVLAYQGIRDFIIWYREGREFARHRKQFKELRRQRRAEKQKMPALKERTKEPPKPPEHPK